LGLLTNEIRRQLPPLYSQEHVKDPLVVCKFFHPLTDMACYAIEFDGEDLFFGWTYSDQPELGYFSLQEMQAVEVMGLGIERDLSFKPKKLSEVKKEHQ
jgi:hypothetical protein